MWFQHRSHEHGVDQNTKPAKKKKKEKLIEAVSKPINMDEEASENNIEDANPTDRIMLFTAVGWSHFDEALLWLPARQLIGKMFSSRKGHIQICFNEIQNQSEMGLLSTKTIQTLPRLQKN